MSSSDLPQETLQFAHRMFDAARHGETELLQAALERGLPANLTNDEGEFVQRSTCDVFVGADVMRGTLPYLFAVD